LASTYQINKPKEDDPEVSATKWVGVLYGPAPENRIRTLLYKYSDYGSNESCGMDASLYLQLQIEISQRTQWIISKRQGYSTGQQSLHQISSTGMLSRRDDGVGTESFTQV
jgi:hypothetical protein